MKLAEHSGADPQDRDLPSSSPAPACRTAPLKQDRNYYVLTIRSVRFTFALAASRSTIDRSSPRDAAATVMIAKGDCCMRRLSGLLAETVQATCPTAVPMA